MDGRRRWGRLLPSGRSGNRSKRGSLVFPVEEKMRSVENRENFCCQLDEFFERLSGSKVVHTSETGRRSGSLEGEEERRAKLKHVSGVIEGNAARNSFHGFRKR